MADEFALLRNAFGGSISLPVDVRRRLKLIFIPYDELLFAFRRNNNFEYLSFQIAIDRPMLPNDYHVIAVQQEFDRQGFSLLVTSSEFEEVTPGERVPFLDEGPITLKVICLQKQSDGSYREAK